MKRRKIMKDRFDGFSVNIFLDEDGDWFAHFNELPSISAFGPTAVKALKELEDAWLATKESYIKDKEPIPVAPTRKEYSGHFNVRVEKRIHRALAIEAAQQGTSLNALVSQKLAASVRI
jgi:predicted HicB family RNase H-like nuclease